MTGDRAPLIAGMDDDAAFDASLRKVVEILRDTVPDESMRRRFDSVLTGRSTLREVLSDAEVQAALRPLADQGLRRLEQMPEPERERLFTSGSRLPC